jgi:hypothetical protein
VRYLLEQRQVREAHGEALQEEADRREAELKARIRAEFRKNERFLRDLMAFQGTPQPRVTVQVFPTPQGSTMGWHITASCEQECIEVLTVSPVFQARA